MSSSTRKLYAWRVVGLTMVSVGFCMGIVGINKAIWYLWVAGLLLEAGALRTAPYTSTGGGR